MAATAFKQGVTILPLTNWALDKIFIDQCISMSSSNILSHRLDMLYLLLAEVEDLSVEELVMLLQGRHAHLGGEGGWRLLVVALHTHHRDPRILCWR